MWAGGIGSDLSDKFLGKVLDFFTHFQFEYEGLFLYINTFNMLYHGRIIALHNYRIGEGDCEICKFSEKEV